MLSSIDIEHLSLTLYGVNVHFIHHPSNVKNYLIGHKSDTGQPVYNLRIHLNLSIRMSKPKINLPRWKSTCPDYFATNIYHPKMKFGAR